MQIMARVDVQRALIGLLSQVRPCLVAVTGVTSRLPPINLLPQ
jgi:hypothetical protein